MLPSRGVSGLRPTSGLRLSLTVTRQPTSSRQYSQIQRLGRSSQQWSPNSAALRGQSTTLPRLAHLSRNPIRVGVASGPSRSLSLWGFGSQPQQQPVGSKAASTSATTPSPAASSTEAPAIGSSPVSPAGSQPVDSAVSSASDIPSAIADSVSSSFVPETFSDFDLEPSILDIPEQIGYLKHLGLDFGWGPTAFCEWMLEHVYIMTGLPWWASISAVALGIRLVWLWPTIIGQRNAAKMALLHKDPEFMKASAEAKQVMWDKDADTMVKMKVQAKVQGMQKRAGVSMLKTLLPPLGIVPLSYGMFRLIRGMSALPVPSLETGGFAWITDLTVYDPTYILPLVSAALSAITIRQTQKANLNPTPQNESMNKFMLYGLTPFMFVCTMWFPAAVQWFFLMFAVTTVVQGRLLNMPAIRRIVDLPPLPGTPALTVAANLQYQAPSRSGIRGILDGAKSNMANVTKGIEDYTGGSAKAAAKKAQEYEKKRAEEEKQKAMSRMLEAQRKRASRRN
ncbi:60Kd inner membrane protein-domain-containing protein [Truncatella angustata]|uniref:60Kd inner membrane protein-domain-containing protein n=1 Tax=Truncatella angustata TaxID=152316 RepID=A0A9P9A0S4_9PEZI|nr:60Kd inner membrane protein-domain-containing protein [Truncatella angustata]KAH6658727.1 60Kd inner membrane protein-domain-containing protein [Truncatella angustata]